MIDGIEARLGSAEFCGVADRVCIGARRRRRSSVLRARQTARTHRDQPDAAAGCSRRRERAARGSASICISSRATASRRCAPIARGARHFAIGRAASSPQKRSRCIEALEGAGPPRADGRRRPQRRAGACRRACFAVADQPPPISRRRRPTRSSWASGCSRCSTLS